jgi:hypothetical protein
LSKRLILLSTLLKRKRRVAYIQEVSLLRVVHRLQASLTTRFLYLSDAQILMKSLTNWNITILRVMRGNSVALLQVYNLLLDFKALTFREIYNSRIFILRVLEQESLEVSQQLPQALFTKARSDDKFYTFLVMS